MTVLKLALILLLTQQQMQKNRQKIRPNDKKENLIYSNGLIDVERG